MKLVDLGADAGAIAAVIGLGALLVKGARMLIKAARKLARMSDEVLGHTDTDGKVHPGWGQRLAGIEAISRTNAARLTDVESSLALVRAEVKPNGGKSLKDQITRIEQATGAGDAPQP